MKNEYKTIPSHPNFEICDEMPMDKCIRTVDTKEYLYVWLNNEYPKVYFKKKLGGDGKQYLIHRLVCETYIGKIPDGMEVDHKDTNKLNYNHLNLRFCSHKQNSNNPLTKKHNSEITKKYFSNIENRKKQAKSVLQIDITTGKIINEFFGIKEAARQTKINDGNISSCCLKKIKSAGGYFWKFK